MISQQPVKPSRPMLMTYYNKLQLVVFALIGEVKIIEMKQNGQKKTFNTMASHSLEHLPVAMDVGQKKSNGKLLIFVACQFFKEGKLSKDKKGTEENCYISVLEIDQLNGYSIAETRIYPSKPQISRIMYKKNYGLIMACYRGYIEHFDGNNFKSVNKWSNNMKAIGSEKVKSKISEL